MVAALAATFVTVASPAPASAEFPPGDGIGLGIDRFEEMVIDPVRGNLFFTAGAATSELRVTDRSGAPLRTFTDLAGAAGLALSPDASTLFVALPKAHSIVSVDTATLTEKQRYYTGINTCPERLAYAGGKLYFGYTCAGRHKGLLGSLDVSGGQPVLTMNLPFDERYSFPPILRGTPGNPNLLLAVNPPERTEPTSAKAALYDVSSGSPEKVASLPDDACLSLRDATVTADASTVILSCAGDLNRPPIGHLAFSATDLSPVGNYPSTQVPLAATTSPDGAYVAVGSRHVQQKTSEIFVARRDGSLVQRYELPPGRIIGQKGLVVSPDNATLYAVTTATSGSDPRLHPLTDYRMNGTSLTLADARADSDPPVSLRGRLTFHDQAETGPQRLRVTRQEWDKTVALPEVTTAADGTFTITDVPDSSAYTTYTVTYPGTPTRVAVTRSLRLWVNGGTSSIALSAPATSPRAAKVTVTGKLTLLGAIPPAPWRLQVVRKDDAGSKTLPAVTTADDGSFSFTDAPPVGGTNTYTVTFVGDGLYHGSSKAVTVQVSKATTGLRISTNETIYGYGKNATVAVKLGTTYTNRTVCIHAQQYGEPRFQLKCGKVNSAGKLSAKWPVHRRTVFTATFSGDNRYAPASVSRTVTTRAMLNSAVVKPAYTKSGSYRIFKRASNPITKTWVSPKNKGACVKYTVQAYKSGKWRTVTSSACRTVNSSSEVAFKWTGSRSTGVKYRVRATLAPTTLNAKSHSNWAYFRFR